MRAIDVDPDFDSDAVAAAVAAALRTIDANMVSFGDRYPGDTTVANRYRLRAAASGQPEGSNVGWTTSFWPGMLWLAYELSGDGKYLHSAAAHVRSFAERMRHRIDIDTHDLGFLYTLSCVVPWRVRGDDTARHTALAAADHLLSRVLEPAGIIQAWGDLGDPDQQGRTIIDSIMNTPLLFWASRTTGELRYAAAARRHIIQLRDHILRPDGTTFHTFYWDPKTGEPLRGATEQGNADDSCWARGQAWAIYGFSLNYRYTGEASFLDSARRCADYFCAHLPADHIPCWDLEFHGGSGQERDSSAAAIAAAGLLELANQLPAGHRDGYHAAAVRILLALVEQCSTVTHPDSNALLLHGVYDKPKGLGVDEGNLWGDYFYLEALTRAVHPGWVSYW